MLACSVPISFFHKWLLVQLSPLLLSGGILLVYSVIALSWWLRNRSKDARTVRSALARYVDLIVGAVMTVFFYFFFALVRGGVELFDCTPDADGRTVLQTQPNVECWRPAHYSLVPWGIGSLVVYGVGVPAAFAWVLWRHRGAMERDVTLWAAGKGDSDATNADYGVRRRYGRLYLDYKSRYFYWKLVLLARKAALVFVTIMFSNNPMFQSSCALSVIIVAYSVHTSASPFLGVPGSSGTAAQPALPRPRIAQTASSRALWIGAGLNAVVTSGRRQLMDLNALEATMLRASLAVLLGGMMFESGQGWDSTSPQYLVLGALVGTIMVGCSTLFVLLLVRETRAVCRRLRQERMNVALKRTGEDPLGSKVGASTRNLHQTADAAASATTADTVDSTVGRVTWVPNPIRNAKLAASVDAKSCS